MQKQSRLLGWSHPADLAYRAFQVVQVLQGHERRTRSNAPSANGSAAASATTASMLSSASATIAADESMPTTTVPEREELAAEAALAAAEVERGAPRRRQQLDEPGDVEPRVGAVVTGSGTHQAHSSACSSQTSARVRHSRRVGSASTPAPTRVRDGALLADTASTRSVPLEVERRVVVGRVPGREVPSPTASM